MRKCISESVKVRLTKVLFVGDTSRSLIFELKGFEVDIIASTYQTKSPLREALETDPTISVTHMPCHDAFPNFPKTAEELAEYDVVIFSDVGADTIVLYPWFQRVPMGPNRLHSIKKYVENGGGFAMAGGYASFQGRRGIGNYYGTPVEEILPVHIFPYDDRVETPEGCHPEVTDPEHPIMAGLPWYEPFLFLGYNKLKLKQGARLLAKVGDDPFIAVLEYGKGRTLAFASDPEPHWAGSFKDWPHYSKFWIQAVKWLAGELH